MSLKKTLQQAATLQKELDQYRPLSPDTEQRIFQKLRLDWNYNSNHLEGNRLSFGETKALIMYGITAQGKPLQDHLEISGHNEAILWIEEMVKEKRPMTENFIRELHEVVLAKSYYNPAIDSQGNATQRKIHIGQYKTTPNHVRTKTGATFYFATPEETPAKMHDLVTWYRDKKEKADLSPILLAAEFHYKFIRIHPFDDGNGRMARLLMNCILLQHGYPPAIIKTDEKEDYFEALQQADAGILEPFLEYIAINVIHSLELMIKGAKGESIEEDDDLDKKIALLEQRVNAQNKTIEKVKSEEVLVDFAKNELAIIIRQYLDINTKFNRFYTQIYFRVNYEDAEKTYTNEALDFDLINIELFNRLLFMINNKPIDSIDSFKLWYKYTNFKSTVIEPFDYTDSLTFTLEHNSYTLESKSGETLTVLYQDEFPTADFEALLKKESDLHLAFIDKKLKGN